MGPFASFGTPLHPGQWKSHYRFLISRKRDRNVCSDTRNCDQCAFCIDSASRRARRFVAFLMRFYCCSITACWGNIWLTGEKSEAADVSTYSGMVTFWLRSSGNLKGRMPSCHKSCSNSINCINRISVFETDNYAMKDMRDGATYLH
jgi:hypothetical protein